MNNAHFFFQHKGGIGKSTLASFFAEFKQEMGKDVANYDADPMNQSFAAYKSLDVTEVDLMKNDEVSKSKVDDFMDDMFDTVEKRKDVEFIVDIGASSYPVISKYFKDNAVFDVLKSEKIKSYLHCPLVGGDMYPHTAYGFASLAERFPNTKIVLWNNTYFGDVADASGVPIEATLLFKKHEKMVQAVINTPKIDDEDIGVKTQHSLLFGECTSQHFKRMQLRRIQTYWQTLFSNIAEAKV